MVRIGAPVVVAVVACGVMVAYLPDSSAPVASTPVASAPPIVGAAQPSPSPTETPSDRTVPRAAPTRLSIPSVGIDAPIEEYTDADVVAHDGWVDPPSRDKVAWWSGGGTPGDPADNTVYLYGHVSYLEAVFNSLDAVTPGDEIAVTTEAGLLTYLVTDVLEPIAKSDLPLDATIAQAVPGRLILIGCYRPPDQGTQPTTHNLVVVARQVPISP